MKMELMGLSGKDVAKRLTEMYQLPISPEEFMDRAKTWYIQLFPGTELMPGAEKLVIHLHTNNIPMALASSSSISNFGLKIANHQELFQKFHHSVFAGTDPEVKKAKPSPDPYLICAKRFPDNPSCDKILVFEDSINGVVSALAAGMQVVMVPDASLEPEDTNIATLVIPTLNDFQPELFGLPPYEQ